MRINGPATFVKKVSEQRTSQRKPVDFPTCDLLYKGAMSTDLSFIKMHGLGNDFVIVDARRAPFFPTAEQVRFLADRRRGIGCDQLIVLEPARTPDAGAFMRILNADGSETAACGNATRCVGWLIMNETGNDAAVIETKAGLLRAWKVSDAVVRVDMGPAGLAPRDLPLSADCDTLHLPLTEGPLTDPVGVSMGNPHAVFFVPDAESVDLSALGPRIERNPLFPERVNVEVAQILAPGRIRMRVWERGAGITDACGTGACATLVAAVRRSLTGRSADVVLDGGVLSIEWRESDGHVLMSGPVALSFHGTVPQGSLP